MRQVALISHFFPSVGHPLDLPIDEWNTLSYELKYIIPISTGNFTQEQSTEMSADSAGWNGSWT
jgi:hypothetical protein